MIKQEKVFGGQFLWGGGWLKGNANVQRLVQLSRKLSAEHNSIY